MYENNCDPVTDIYHVVKGHLRGAGVLLPPPPVAILEFSQSQQCFSFKLLLKIMSEHMKVNCDPLTHIYHMANGFFGCGGGVL